jgi:3-phosphoinositide dependent protein kinase-1
MNVCKLHPKLQNLWVCVERECTYRVMCSTCAVKFHDRNHKIEEINLLN